MLIFTVRTIQWNNLPESAVECSSINLFKNLIDSYKYWTNKQYVIAIESSVLPNIAACTGYAS